MLDSQVRLSVVASACAVLVFGVLIGVNVVELSGQTLSPSVNKQTSKRLQALSGKSSIESELKAAASKNIEPRQALLNSLNTLIPMDATADKLKDPLLAAVDVFLTGDMQGSHQKLSELVQQNAQLPPASIMIAGMLFATGNQQAGRAWMERTTMEHPQYPSTYTGFARVAISEKRVTDAEALLEKAERLIQDGDWSSEQAKLFQTELLDGLTDVAISRQRLEKARGHLLELDKLLPDNAKVLLRLAQIEFDLEDLDKSLAYLKRTRELTPNLRVPEVIVADWLLRKQKLPESERYITQAATEHPDDPNVQLDFGKWLLRNERLPQALETVNKAEQLGADPYVVGLIKGQVFFARRSYGVAEMHFQNLNQQRPSDGDAANMLALSLIESTDDAKRTKALELATMNQKVFPRSPTAAATLGWVLYRLGRKAEAENVFKQVMATKNIEPASAYFVATYLSDHGSAEAAVNLLTAALAKPDYFMFRNAAKELLDRINEKTKKESKPTAGNDQSK